MPSQTAHWRYGIDGRADAWIAGSAPLPPPHIALPLRKARDTSESGPFKRPCLPIGTSPILRHSAIGVALPFPAGILEVSGRKYPGNAVAQSSPAFRPDQGARWLPSFLRSGGSGQSNCLVTAAVLHSATRETEQVQLPAKETRLPPPANERSGRSRSFPNLVDGPIQNEKDRPMLALLTSLT